MYFWKCWRDTRSAFFTFLGAIITAAVLHRAVAADWFHFASSQRWGIPQGVWEQTAEVLLRLTMTLIPLAGFVIGAIGMGSEFGKQTLPFLLTRPRPRWFYFWSSWLIGATQIVILIFLAVLLYETRLAVPGATPGPHGEIAGILRATVALLVPGGVIYCLTFAFAVLLRKEQHGTNAAIATVFAYSGLVTILRLLYEVRIPVFWEFYVRAFDASRPLPLVAVTGWLGFSLLLAVVAHFYFERVEV